LKKKQLGRSPAQQRLAQSWVIGLCALVWALTCPLAHSRIKFQSPELFQTLDQPWQTPRSDQTWRQRWATAKLIQAINGSAQASNDRSTKILAKALSEAESQGLIGARVSILYRLGALQAALGRHTEAAGLLTDAVALARETYGASSVQHAICQAALALVQGQADTSTASAQEIRGILETFDRVFGPDHGITVDAEETLAPILVFSDPVLAEKRLRHALAAREAARDNDPKDMFILHYHLSNTAIANRGFEAAARDAALADEFAKRVDIEDEHRGANELLWAKALTSQDRPLEAEPHFQNARQKLAAKYDEELGHAAFSIAVRFDQQALSEKAASYAEQSLALFTRAHLPPNTLADNLDLLASVYDKMQKDNRAREALRERIRLDPTARFAPAFTASTFDRIIRKAIDGGELAAAEPLIDYALKLHLSEPGTDGNRRLSWLLREQGRLRLARGAIEGAIESLRKAEDLYTILPRGHGERLINEVLLGTALTLMHEDQEAYQLLRDAMALYVPSVQRTAWQADSSLALAEVAARKLTNVRDVVSIYRWSCDVYVDVQVWEGATDCIERLARYLRAKQRLAELDSTLREYAPKLGDNFSPSSRALLDFWFARTLLDRRLPSDAEPYRRKLAARCGRSPELAALCSELLADVGRSTCQRCQAVPFLPDLMGRFWD
jgi:tetratricopeptide (TPR) repeat protein